VCKGAGEVGHCTMTAGMGLGWEVRTVNGVTILNHDGSDWGVKTLAMFVPSQGIGVIVFTNGENGTEVIRKVVEALYPKPAIRGSDLRCAGNYPEFDSGSASSLRLLSWRGTLQTVFFGFQEVIYFFDQLVQLHRVLLFGCLFTQFFPAFAILHGSPRESV
jgi:Beta-lactamase